LGVVNHTMGTPINDLSIPPWRITFHAPRRMIGSHTVNCASSENFPLPHFRRTGLSDFLMTTKLNELLRAEARAIIIINKAGLNNVVALNRVFRTNVDMASHGGRTKWQTLWQLRRFGLWALVTSMGPIQGGFDLLAGQQAIAMVIFTENPPISLYAF
jgi:hypothetical protein